MIDFVERYGVCVFKVSEISSKISKAESFEEGFFVWLNRNQEISVSVYNELRKRKNFLGIVGEHLSLDELEGILDQALKREINNLKYNEIIEKAKSQNRSIEDRIANLNFEVADKTEKLRESQSEIKKNVKFERQCLFILRGLLQTSNFFDFYKFINQSLRPFSVKEVVVFLLNDDGTYSLITDRQSLKSMRWSLSDIMNGAKFWANQIKTPVVDFYVYPLGEQKQYYMGVEYKVKSKIFFEEVKSRIEYLEDIFVMVLNALNHKERVLQESLLWSNSFDSFEDPLLIIDESFDIIRSNKSEKWAGQKCFRVMFGRDEPCKSCPIKEKTFGTEKYNSLDPSRGVNDQFRLTSFPFEPSLSGGKKIWIHHYESQSKINDLKAQSLQKEKFSYVGHLVDDVIHRISNPLTGMKMAVENIIKEEPCEDFDEIYSALNRCFSIISNLQKFTEGCMDLEPSNLKEMIQSTLQLMKTATRQVQVQLDIDDKIEVICPRGLVQQVLFNLVHNSCQAMEFKGNLKFEACVQEDEVELLVGDDGPGVDQDIAHKIFEPFFFN